MGYSSYEPQLIDGSVGRFTDHPTDGNTVAHWTFDRDDTDQVGAFDQSGITSDVCYAPIFGFGYTKNALAVNWTNGYARLNAGGIQSLTEMTVACWVCLNDYPVSTVDIIGFRVPGAGSGNPNTQNFGFSLATENDGTLHFLWQNADKDNQDVVGPIIPLNQWTHLLATRNAAQDTSRIYVNGVQYAESTGLLPFNGGTSADDLRFMYDGSTNAQRGLLASTIIQNVEFDDAAASALYNATLVSGP